MGVLEFFGTLIKNDITSTSIQTDFRGKMNIHHLLLDFNSIVHVSSQKVISDINLFLKMVLKNLYNKRSINHIFFAEKFEKYKMTDIQEKINQDSDPQFVIDLFHEHFDDQYVDKLVITLVINTVIGIVKTYCNHKTIKTLMLAIDGVPSKGKMIEQKQRRYLSAITESYKKKILNKYKDYLLEQEDYVYLATKQAIQWSRNKITPGTAFMHKMVNYLQSEKIMEKMKINRPNMNVIISDMYEVGEGEKKIVNYANKYLVNDETTVIYSPDADMILLCMLMPIHKLYMLRHNQQTSAKNNRNVYDLIDIHMLKNNISYYINNHPEYPKEDFDTERINRDIVCMSTLFGNDFVPKIETMNVKKGFQTIMDAYLKSLVNLKSKGYYLVKNKDDQFKLNFTFLKDVISNLLPEEDDYIKHNKLYAQYITVGQMKNVFDYMEINAENIVSTYNSFRKEYDDLKNVIKNNGNLTYYETNDQFMNSLKKSALVIIDGSCVNTSYLTNKEMIDLLKRYYRKYRDFPRLNINLNTWSHSINDHIHKNEVKTQKMNEYDKEIYKFNKMLDEYYIKFNAEPLDLTADKIDDFYFNYFGVKLYSSKNTLTKEANQVMHDYLEGMLWVFNYYYNDMSYVNKWYYVHERAPLMRHFLLFLKSINHDYFDQVFNDLDQYRVEKLSDFFNPIEQLIYVSPMTNEIIKLLPSNYQKYITSESLDPFLREYFVDIELIVEKLWKEKVAKEIDCRGIPYFNKCLIKTLEKPTSEDDKLFLKAIRKVKPNDASIRRSKSRNPDY